MCQAFGKLLQNVLIDRLCMPHSGFETEIWLYLLMFILTTIVSHELSFHNNTRGCLSPSFWILAAERNFEGLIGHGGGTGCACSVAVFRLSFVLHPEASSHSTKEDPQKMPLHNLWITPPFVWSLPSSVLWTFIVYCWNATYKCFRIRFWLTGSNLRCLWDWCTVKKKTYNVKFLWKLWL